MLLAKVGITLLTLGLLYHSVFAAPDTAAAWRQLVAATLSGAGRGPVLAALALVPLNWCLEAWKWQLLARHLEPDHSFGRSLRAVLLGLTLGFATPNRVGDYAARILELHSRRRLDAVGAVFLGRYAQLVATVLAGGAGLLFFLIKFYLGGYPAAQIGVVAAAGLAGAAVLLPLYRSRLLLAVLALVRPLRRFRRYLAVMPTYRPAEAARGIRHFRAALRRVLQPVFAAAVCLRGAHVAGAGHGSCGWHILVQVAGALAQRPGRCGRARAIGHPFVWPAGAAITACTQRQPQFVGD